MKQSNGPSAARAPVVMVPRLLRPAMAAQYLGVSVSRLAELDIRRIRNSPLGRGVVAYDRLDLDAFADSLSDAAGGAGQADTGGW
ncbi:hypothetical protein ACQ5SO_07520 [Rhodovulum sp. DZ06]|uniref:hypothetical protein n=1 Tax=Rhodovulum sp. DZ06 TaxID=3425126 RepID=UPI003D33D456